MYHEIIVSINPPEQVFEVATFTMRFPIDHWSEKLGAIAAVEQFLIRQELTWMSERRSRLRQLTGSDLDSFARPRREDKARNLWPPAQGE